MKTTATAINRVYKILSESVTEVEVPIYKHRSPSIRTLPDEYVVVNALPVGKGVLQSCIVNVNWHVKDEGMGMPDIESLEAGQNAVIALLHLNDNNSDSVYIEFESESTIAESEKESHYSNMRFKVVIKN